MAHYNDADVGCGRCIACRVNTTRDWALRLTHESYSYEWQNCAFLTLTVDDKHCDGSCHIDDLSNFFDDLKPYYKKFKRLGVSEYGLENDRPHYHAVTFGTPYTQDLVDQVQRFWSKGFTATLPFFGQATGNYVAGYVIKKLYGEDVYPDVEPPTLRCSNGIGKDWCLAHADEILRDGLIYDNYGVVHRVPRYYRKLLDMDMSEYLEHRDLAVLRHNEKLVRRTAKGTLVYLVNAYHEQIDRIIANRDWIGYYNLMEIFAAREQENVRKQRIRNTIAKTRRLEA